MTETKKASDLRVGDVMLVAHMPIGAMSLTTGKFERDEGGAYDEECLIVAVEATTEDGWPKDWTSVDEYGPHRVIAGPARARNTTCSSSRMTMCE